MTKTMNSVRSRKLSEIILSIICVLIFTSIVSINLLGCAGCSGGKKKTETGLITSAGSKVASHDKRNEEGTPVPQDTSIGNKLNVKEISSVELVDKCYKCGVGLPANALYCYSCGASQHGANTQKVGSSGTTKVDGTDKKDDKVIPYIVSYNNSNFDIKKCKASANAGDPTAQYNLAMCYLFGYNEKKSGKDAIKYFTLSAEQGNTEAARKLGNCYYYGDAVKEDKAEAVKWYLMAANGGDALAQCNLGECYFDGEGVAQDKTQAMFWYLSAAKNGDATAQEYIGECSLDGIGMARDEKEAFRWFKKASEKGNVTALYNLGWCYNNGVGCVKSQDEAVKYLTEAAKLGDEDAIALLKEIEDAKTKSNDKPADGMAEEDELEGEGDE